MPAAGITRRSGGGAARITGRANITVLTVELSKYYRVQVVDQAREGDPKHSRFRKSIHEPARKRDPVDDDIG